MSIPFENGELEDAPLIGPQDSEGLGGMTGLVLEIDACQARVGPDGRFGLEAAVLCAWYEWPVRDELQFDTPQSNSHSAN